MKYYTYIGNDYQFDIDKYYVKLPIEDFYTKYSKGYINFELRIPDENKIIIFQDERYFFSCLERYVYNPYLEPKASFHYLKNAVVCPIYVDSFSKWLEKCEELMIHINSIESQNLWHRARGLIWREIILQIISNREDLIAIFTEWIEKGRDY